MFGHLMTPLDDLLLTCTVHSVVFICLHSEYLLNPLKMSLVVPYLIGLGTLYVPIFSECLSEFFLFMDLFQFRPKFGRSTRLIISLKGTWFGQVFLTPYIHEKVYEFY